MKNSFWLFGSNLTVLASENETDSNYDLIEGFFPPGSATPLHLHTRYSETIYVVAGEVTVYTPGEQFVLRAGDSHFIPTGTPHTVVNNSKDQPFKALAIAAPSGFARLIRTAGLPGAVDGPLPDTENDFNLVIKIMEEIGDKNIGAPGILP